jgi:hypothetical protein
MGLRNIQLPLICWEISREMLSIPSKLRSSRRLVLEVINNVAPQLTTIPNDNGEPMQPLMLTTFPCYLRYAFLTGTKTLLRVRDRYISSSGPRSTVITNQLPSSWVTVVVEGQRIRSIFEQSVIKRVCLEAGAPSRTSGVSRAFHTMLTIELLLSAVPNICNRVTFNAGPEIPS